MSQHSLNPTNSLRGKLLVAFVVAIFLPLLLVVFFSITGATEINQQNLAERLLENGVQHSALLQTEVAETTDAVQQYLSDEDNRARMRGALLPTSAATENRVIRANYAREALRELTEQLPDELMGGWILPKLSNNPDIFVATESSGFSSQTLQGLALDSAAEVRANNILSESEYWLVGGESDGVPYLAIASPFVLGSGADAEHLGYVVIALNTNALLIEPLVMEATFYPHDSFVLFPDAETGVALDGSVFTEAPVMIAPEFRSGVINSFRTSSGQDALLFFNSITPESLASGEILLIQTLDTTIAQREVLEYVGRIGFPLIVGVVVLLFIVLQLLDQMLTPPLLQLVDAMRSVVRGYYDVPLPARSRDDEIGTLTNAFIDMREKIKTLTQEMEARLQARIHDVQVTQDITRAITAERDLGYLMNQVVHLIVENFPHIYHAQIFLLDAQEDYAVLRASTGEAGQELLQRGHKLRVGSVSVIGQAVELREPNVAYNTATSSIHRRNEFLPETRAELAVPLKFGRQMIGALDVQSRQRDSFSEDFINTMQTLADQIAVAIENARLYEQSARLLADLQRQRQNEAREAWTEFLRARRVTSQTHQAGVATETDFRELIQAAYRSRKTIVGSATARGTVPFVVPIVMKDTTIGTVEYEVPQHEFANTKVQLAEDLVSRLTVSLENNRLFQESRKTAQRERLVNDIAATISMETEVQAILETALREVGQALQTPNVSIRLDAAAGSSDLPLGNGNGNGNGKHPAATTHNEQPSSPE